MKIRRVVAIALAASSLAWNAGSALADDAEDVARQQADVSFREGQRLYKQGDYQRAWYEFSKANAIYPRASLLRSLGLCELKLNKPVDALAHFRAALAAPDLKPDQRAPTQEDIATAYALTGHITIRTNDGAAVTVDGQALASVPKDPVDVMPGHHVVEARVGPRSTKRDVETTAGAVQEADIYVEGPASAAPASAPVARSAAPAPSDRPTVHDLAMPPATPEQSSFWNARRGVGVAVAGAGLVALGLSVFFDSQASSSQSQAVGTRLGPSDCFGSMPAPGCSSLSDAYSSQNTNATLSYLFLGVGIVGVVSGAALLLWPTSKSSSSSASLVPLVSPFGGGLQLRGEL